MKKKILKIVFILLFSIALFSLTGCENAETIDNKSEKKQNQINTTQKEENVTNNNVKNETDESQNKTSNSSKNAVSSRFKIGDYVEYNAGVGNSYIAKAEKTGYSKDQEFVTTGKEIWKVLSINNDGTINIVSENAIGTKYDKELYFKGEKGFDNSVEELNNICKIYGNNPSAISARSLNDEDIVNLFDMDKVVKYYQDKSETDITGTEINEQLNQIYKYINPSNGESIDVRGKTVTYNAKFNWDTTGTGMGFNAAITDDAKLSVADIKNKEKVWLANKIIGDDGVKERVAYGVYFYGYYRYDNIYVTDFRSEVLYDAKNDRSSERGKFIRPVVTLKADVEVSGSGTSDNPYIVKTDGEVTSASTSTESVSNSNSSEGIKVGTVMVKFGTYNGDAAVAGDILKLNSDGTATLNGERYTYKVENSTFAQDISNQETKQALVFKGNNSSTFTLYVEDNGNTLTQGSGMDYIYSEN